MASMIRTYPIMAYATEADIGGTASRLCVLHYEAPRHFTRAPAIERWAQDMEWPEVKGPHSVYFGDTRVGRFMELYNAIDPELKAREPGREIDDRKRFTRSPFDIVTVDGETAGGIWPDSVDRKNGHVHIHIVVGPEHRGSGVADFLLNIFEWESIQYGRYGSVGCGFGSRKDCDPSRFFRRHGYDVTGSMEEGGYARKELRELPEVEFEIIDSPGLTLPEFRSPPPSS